MPARPVVRSVRSRAASRQVQGHERSSNEAATLAPMARQQRGVLVIVCPAEKKG